MPLTMLRSTDEGRKHARDAVDDRTEHLSDLIGTKEVVCATRRSRP
jgi:hypothetical protein